LIIARVGTIFEGKKIRQNFPNQLWQSLHKFIYTILTSFIVNSRSGTTARKGQWREHGRGCGRVQCTSISWHQPEFKKRLPHTNQSQSCNMAVDIHQPHEISERHGTEKVSESPIRI